MKLVTDEADLVSPAKTLSKLPEWLPEEKVSQFKNLRIIDLGNLHSFRKCMVDNTDFKHKRGNSSMKNDSWSGTDTWEDYMTLLEDGDDKVIEKIKVETGVQVKELAKKYKEVISNYRFDVVGQFFDVGLVVTGVPEVWLEPELDMEEGDKVCVDIVINGAFHCGIDEKMIVDHCARILAISKILEDHGVQVKLLLMSTNHRYRDKQETLMGVITLKGYDEPINYRKLSSILTPAFHRRAMFKIMELQAPDLSSGYGSPRDLEGFVSLNSKRSIDDLEKKLFGGKR